MFKCNSNGLLNLTTWMVVGLLWVHPQPAWSAEFEGKLDFFGDMDWEQVQREVDAKNRAVTQTSTAGRPQAGSRDSSSTLGTIREGASMGFAATAYREVPEKAKGPFEMAQTTEVTIQLEKKMPPSPAMQGTGDRPFLGPDPFEDDFIEEDPFAAEEPEIPELKDPLEGINRKIYNFNEAVYENLLKPVASTYRDLVHEEIRIAVRNLFNNALAPIKLFSSLIQFDFEKSGRVLSRTLINTAFGWGGMLDVAGQEYEIKDVNEDFNQALGYHGVGSGPYVVLPFLGPSTTRGLVGRIVDSFLSPTIVVAPGFAAGAAMSGTRMVNDTSFRIEDIDQLKKDAIDPYVSMRDFYHQYTEKQILK